jgi:outer membrane immunogenic protein
MKKFLLATVSMVALTSVTRAADMPAAMPAKGPMYSPIPVATWSGAYVGVQGGVVRHDAKDTLSLTNFTEGRSKTGGTAGALLGYNWQLGNFVYGLEGDWSWISAKASQATPESGFNSYEVNWLSTVRARVGFADDSTLFYLAGGAAFAHVQNSSGVSSGLAIGLSYPQDQTRTGWTVGAGVEHRLAPHWVARAELRYVDLGKSSVDCVPGRFGCGINDRAEFSNSLVMGLLGLNYQFGGDRARDWSQARAYVPPSVPTWAGTYIGLQGGIAWHDGSFSVDHGLFAGDQFLEQKKAGGTVGGLLGYNWQQGGFVYGVEGDWNWVGGKTSRTAPDFNSGFQTLSNSYDVNWLATLRARAGLAFDATLLYVTGGLAFGHVKNSVEASINAVPIAQSFSQNETRVGWTAGVGAEYMLTQHWTARAEFRYVDLGKASVSCGVSGAPDFDGCISNGYRGEFSNRLMLGLIGLAYKF